MNRYLLHRDYGVALEEPLAAEDVISYLAALYLVAREGGASIEEELFVEAWADYLEIEKTWTLEAFEVSLRQDLPALEHLQRIRLSPLRHALVRDAFRIIRLDGRIDPPETRIVVLFCERLGIAAEMVTMLAAAVEKEAHLLGLFHELVAQTQPAVSHERLLHCAIDRLRSERTVLLPSLEGIASEVIASSLAFIQRLGGLTHSTREESAFLAAVSEEFGQSHAVLERAEALAWNISIPSSALLEKIDSAALRVMLFRDTHRLLSLDGRIDPREDRMLRQMAGAFGYDSAFQANLRHLLLEEADVRAILSIPQTGRSCQS
jgi:hypothetical protein